MLDGEPELLQRIVEVLREDSDRQVIRSLVDQRKHHSRSGTYESLVTDVRAFFELDQREDRSWVVTKMYSGRTRAAIRALLIERILAALASTSVPDRLFEPKTLRVKYDDRLIDVEEVARRNWDYIIYRSINYSDAYYADVMYDGVFSYSKLLKLDAEEIATVERFEEESTAKMIAEKRNANGGSEGNIEHKGSVAIRNQQKQWMKMMPGALGYFLLAMALPLTGWSQGYREIGLYAFIADNALIIDTVTARPIDQHTLLDRFIYDEVVEDPDHYQGVRIDTYRRIADGYLINRVRNKTLLKQEAGPVAKSAERDFTEMTAYYELKARSDERTRDTVYLFSRPRYSDLADGTLYPYASLAAGSYRLSSVTVDGQSQPLSACYLKQGLEILPDSHFLLHYGDDYAVDCEDANGSFYERVYDVNPRADTVAITTQGTGKYVLAGRFLYLFTDDEEFIARLTVQQSGSVLILVDERSVRYTYTRSERD